MRGFGTVVLFLALQEAGRRGEQHCGELKKNEAGECNVQVTTGVDRAKCYACVLEHMLDT